MSAIEHALNAEEAAIEADLEWRQLRALRFVELVSIEGTPTTTTRDSECPTPLRPWTWAHRVLEADQPESQEPGSSPFFYLACPLRIAYEGVEA